MWGNDIHDQQISFSSRREDSKLLSVQRRMAFVSARKLVVLVGSMMCMGLVQAHNCIMRIRKGASKFGPC